MGVSSLGPITSCSKTSRSSRRPAEQGPNEAVKSSFEVSTFASKLASIL